MKVKYNLLAAAWAKDFANSIHNNDGNLVSALHRSLPLLEEGPTSVPFVCRYRSDVIAPLTTPQIHQLCDRLVTFKTLESLRNRVLERLPSESDELRRRVETSYSKTELEDIYAPFKPPSKGSLEDRIRKEHPQLSVVVDSFWNDSSNQGLSKKLRPREAAIVLLANRIAAHTATTDAVLENVRRHCRIQTKEIAANNKEKKGDRTDSKVKHDDKYKSYHDFSSSLDHIRDHQVLAIRRGVAQKALRVSYDIDGDRVESLIRRCLMDNDVLPKGRHDGIWKEAIHDAWSRLLRRRCTTRLWTEKSQVAEQRSIQVFCDNLYKALLQPPMTRPRPVLALDPGFQAGIKCAMLNQYGELISLGNARSSSSSTLTTVHFVKDRDSGVQQLTNILETMRGYQEKQPNLKGHGNEPLTVALGNGHGSQEARALLLDASEKSGVGVHVEIVNEAGASVWSVTEDASKEFPNQSAASIAAVSIGRRCQNAMPELVKIPPRSLGLGMYQHDLNEKDLDDKLHFAAVNAVAEVGVDGNSCSIQILEKVPGLTNKLCQRIIEARPLKSRQDLLERVSGLGPKTFENCAAFIRIPNGDSSSEPLDETMVHPESYGVARFLLKKLNWDLLDRSSVDPQQIPPTVQERKDKWGKVIEAASRKCSVPADRVISVIDHLVVSMTNPDPRLVTDGVNAAQNRDHTKGCEPLPAHLSSSVPALRAATPLRGIVGTVRNVVDFGAFVDIGAENDGLLHISKLGPSASLSSLMVGQEIGVDVLSVSSNYRIALGIHGSNLIPDPEKSRGSHKKAGSKLGSSGKGSKRGYKTLSSSVRKRQRTQTK